MAGQTDETIDLLAVVRTLRKGWKWLAAGFVVGSLVAVVVALLQTPLYESKSTWLPAKTTDTSPLSGLASLAGLAGVTPGSNGNEAYYGEILSSAEFLIPVLKRRWPLQNGDSAFLAEVLEKDSANVESPAPWVSHKEYGQDRMIEWLRTTGVDFENRKTAFALKVLTPDPVMSRAINSFLLERLKYFNQEVRKDQATMEREFFESQLADFQKELLEAENGLLSFYRNNIDLSAPYTKMRENRLKREVNILSGLVLEFRKQLEMARVNEARQAESFEMLQDPSLPWAKMYPQRRLMVMGGAVAGTGLGAIFLILLGWWKRNRHLL